MEVMTGRRIGRKVTGKVDEVVDDSPGLLHARLWPELVTPTGFEPVLQP